MIPVVEVFLLCLHELYLLLGVVDECAQLALLSLTQGVAEDVVHLALDVSRCILQHMLERLVFSMQVGEEVLSTLWQVLDGLQVDDFRENSRLVGELAGQYIQILQLCIRKIALFHVFSWHTRRHCLLSLFSFLCMLFVIIVHQLSFHGKM